MSKFGRKLRGVNLGGWLVLEKWMTPSLFSGKQATDETTLCVEMGQFGREHLHSHWSSFITESDFEWLSQHGLDAVRIPVGFWIFGPPYPFHPKFGSHHAPFVEGGLTYLDLAFKWAEKHGLFILLDLHTAPGCQNGFDNGGLHGVCEWWHDEAARGERREYTLQTLERLAERYGKSPALIGIEVLNEPRWDIPTDFLKSFTVDAYHRIRKHTEKNEVAVVFNDGFRSYREYQGFMPEPEFANVVVDIHRYQCFNPADLHMDIYGHIQKAAIEWKNEADEITKHLGLWGCVGEWSLGLDLKVVSLWAEGPFNHCQQEMDDVQKTIAYRAYGASQLATFEKYLWWFFWSYKTEDTPAWCFRDCVEKGWLPSQYK